MMTPDIIEKLRTQTAGMLCTAAVSNRPDCRCFRCAVSGLIEVIDEKREEIDQLESVLGALDEF